MVLTRGSFINMSLVWLNQIWDHFGIPKNKKQPGKTMPQTVQTRRNSAMLPAKFTAILSVQVFFWGDVFFVYNQKGEP